MSQLTTLTESEIEFKLYQLARREPRNEEEQKFLSEYLHPKRTLKPSGLDEKTS